MNIEFFIGRFHPLVVHLPIGFLLLAGLMQVLALTSKKSYRALTPAISFTLFWGACACVAASVMGWLLARGGGYDDETLFWHKWLGIGLTVLTFFGWLLKSKKIRLPKSVFYYALGTMIILITATGHLGGNLTHGSTYLLQYAPPVFQNVFGYNADENNVAMQIPSTPDSVVVFEHLIMPVLQARCSSCHNETKTNGGLNVTTIEDIMFGGDYGDVLAAGSPLESELFRRLTLPQSSKKFMPPKGDPLTYSELKLLEWWILNGADFDQKLLDDEVPEQIHALLLRDYGVDTKPKPYFERVAVAPLPEETFTQISQAGFLARHLADENNFLEVTPSRSSVNMEQLQTLSAAKEQITWLNLSNQEITDDMLATLGQFTNLTQLRLENNPITDKGMDNLTGLAHLETLNLYGTAITDETLGKLDKFPALKKLYLWQTEVSPEAVEALEKNRPGLTVNTGVQFTAQNE